MRHFLSLILSCYLSVILAVFDKVALLIGNKDYDHSEKLGKLYHPTNDVRDIAGVLQSIGFKVGCSGPTTTIH